MKMMLSYLAIAAVVQGSVALLAKTSPFAQDDQDVVKVVDPDIVAELPEQHRSIALTAKTKKHKHAKHTEFPFAEENDNEEIVKVVEPDIVTDLTDKHSSMALATKSNRKSHKEVHVAQENDNEEIVKVVEPDIVTDLNDKRPMALATKKTTRKDHKEFPFAEQEDPEIVRVVEPDIVSDSSDSKAMPTKSLVQHTAKAKVVDMDASGSDAEDGTVRTVEADVVQDDTKNDEKMDAKIELKDQDQEDEETVMTVDFNKVPVDDAKGKVAKNGVRDVATPKANVTSVVHENTSVPTAHQAAKKLSTLSVKRRLRGPFVVEDEEEYVEPSKVAASMHDEEKWVDVTAPTRQSQVEPMVTGKEVEADVVEPPKMVDDSPRVPQVIYDNEDDQADGEERRSVAHDSNDQEEVHETAQQRHQKSCDEGNEFNDNDC